MSLNDIQLPAALVADIYKNVLLQSNDEKTTLVAKKIISQKDTGPVADSIVNEPATVQWKYLGNNLKKIVLLVNYNDAVHLPDQPLNFLTTILSACKLSLADVAILNYYNYNNITLKEIQAELKGNTVVLFDITPAQLSMAANFPQFQVQRLNGIAFLTAPALDAIEADRNLKTQLWNCLKTIFNL